jgi:hypothetical protein
MHCTQGPSTYRVRTVNLFRAGGQLRAAGPEPKLTRERFPGNSPQPLFAAVFGFSHRGPAMQVEIDADTHSLQPGKRGDFGRSSLLACAIAGALLVAAAQITLANKRSTLPEVVFFAKTIYVDNQANDASLQNSAYLALAHWGHFQVVETPNKADMVLRLTGSSVVSSAPRDTPPDMRLKSARPAPGENDVLLPNGAAVAPEGFTRLTLMDGKSGAVLWTDLSRTNKADMALHMLDGLRDAVTQGLKDRGKY